MYLRLFAFTALLALGSQQAQAAVTFTYDSPALPDGASDNQISQYMTSLYGSTVVFNDGQTDRNGFFNPYFWAGHSAPNNYIATDVQNLNGQGLISYLTIDFAIPISSLSFDGKIFRESTGDDFTVRGYNAATLNSANLVYTNSYQGASAGFSSGTIFFSTPVTRLYFSNNLVHDIGIDNLAVTPTPEPTTIALALSGLGVLGVSHLRRQRRQAIAVA